MELRDRSHFQRLALNIKNRPHFVNAPLREPAKQAKA